MASIPGDPVVQFYATCDDLLAWFQEWIPRFRLHYVLAKQFPQYRACQEVPWERPGAARKLIGSFEELILGLDPLDIDVAHINELTARNPHALRLDLPRVTRAGMTQGFVGFGTRTARYLKVWRQLREDLIARTRAGLWYGNPSTGGKWHDEDMRYTVGVVEAVRGGLRLLAGGHVVVSLEPPAEASAATTRTPRARRQTVAPERRYLEAGDPVFWWKPEVGGRRVLPVRATVLAVNAQRVKIAVEGEAVVRQVAPLRLQRPFPPPAARRRSQTAAVAQHSRGRPDEPLTPLVKRGKYWYGDTPNHICAALIEYTKTSPEPVKDFARAVCPCGNDVFGLLLDEEEQVAQRLCTACDREHYLVDSGEFARNADLDLRECLCGGEDFQIVGAVGGYDDEPADGKWFHLGCRCVACGCSGCYDTWLVRWCRYPWWHVV